MEIQEQLDKMQKDILKFNSKEKFDYILILWFTINAIDSQSKRRRLMDKCYKLCKKGGKLIIIYKSGYRSYKYLLYFWLKQSYYCIFPFQVFSWFDNNKFNWKQKNIGSSVIVVGEK